MKTTIYISLLLAAVCQWSSAVTVTEGKYKFSLELVKELGALMNGNYASAQQSLSLVEAIASNQAMAVCANPSLPKEFKPLCQSKDAAMSLTRLAFVAARSDACEICESVACTGC